MFDDRLKTLVKRLSILLLCKNLCETTKDFAIGQKKLKLQPRSYSFECKVGSLVASDQKLGLRQLTQYWLFFILNLVLQVGNVHTGWVCTLRASASSVALGRKKV